mgnify:CR=1 FL=1
MSLLNWLTKGQSRTGSDSRDISRLVTFRDTENTNGNRYEVYRAKSKADAMAFLRSQEVREERRYIVVETPEGNLGKDLIMIFNEATNTRIEFGERRQLEKPATTPGRCARCGYTVLTAGAVGIAPGVTESYTLVLHDELKEKGVGFVCAKCKTLWCPFCVSSGEPVCATCGERMRLYTE